MTPTMPSTFHALLLSALGVPILLPRPAAGQCTPSDGVDTLEAVNQSRQLTLDFEEMRDLFYWDIEGLREYAADERIPESRWYTNATLLAAKSSNGSLHLCTSDGDLPVELERQWFALVAWLDSYDTPLGLRLFLFSQSAKLVEPKQKDIAGRTFASYGQPLLALEAQYTEWLAITAGWIMAEELGTHPDLREPVTAASGSGQPLLQARVPALRLAFSSLLRSGASEVTRIAMERFPLPELPVDLSAEVAQLAFEDQTTASLGVGWFARATSKDDWPWRLGALVATEHNPFRLRELKTDASLETDYAGTDGRAQVALFASWSLFNSGRLEERTGRSLVHGGEAGFRIGASIPLLLFVIEGFAGVNRPQTLELFPEVVHKTEWGFRFGFRFYTFPIG